MPTPGDSVLAIIPARVGSTRFPRKMLANETGSPLICHVLDRVRAAPSVARVVVATDAEEIASAVRRHGGQAVMTSPSHPNGTSRLDEAAQALGLPEEQVIVNVQGDEPEIESQAIEGAVAALVGPDGARRDIGTVATPFRAGERPEDPNLVKVVRRHDGAALYFSRSPIPHASEGFTLLAMPLRHVGIYAYRRSTLRRYVVLTPTPLEAAERLEQLRALEHGWTIGVEIRECAWQGIDTPAQYEAFVARWRAAHP